jgi:hypothetical protein
MNKQSTIAPNRANPAHADAPPVPLGASGPTHRQPASATPLEPSRLGLHAAGAASLFGLAGMGYYGLQWACLPRELGLEAFTGARRVRELLISLAALGDRVAGFVGDIRQSELAEARGRQMRYVAEQLTQPGLLMVPEVDSFLPALVLLAGLVVIWAAWMRCGR